ncbi:LysR family transcriptional regulator [Sphingomonas sp. BIUV-7]|uniref:LysR family transcriptional regulator n=1 Tax=Sphingomonas natans TaxID=3063330 RepID=A0ABT8Y8R5_9SPHN|nr:LysR family transcriptional regulator [Sphingomonas sp. BIUV-7]MDO6414716.1 LysR family transcriptional regulator [Sphingomonas sp. BIUV-7]
MDRDYALYARIVAAGSLSGAGRALGVSPSWVSKRLSDLEQRLGSQLITRSTRRLALTAAGVRFHADVLAILAAAAAAEARVKQMDNVPSGPLRITAPTSFGRLHIAPYLKPFLDLYPAIQLSMDLSDRFVDLAGEGIDIAVRITAAVDPRLAVDRLGDSPRVLCAAPAYLVDHGAPPSLDSLGSHRLLAANGQLPWRLSGPDGEAVVTAPSAVETNSSEVVRELALAGVGIALRSLWDVQADLASNRLIRVLPDYEGSSEVGIYAVHLRTTRPRPALLAFRDFLTDVVARSIRRNIVE